MRKMRRLHADWSERADVEWIAGGTCSREDLLFAHEADYLDGTLSGAWPDGLGSRTREWHLWNCGAWMKAARLALLEGGIVGALAGGFHHAGPKDGWGFCTFNAMAATAIAFASEGRKAAILDADRHVPDGTIACLERAGLRSKRPSDSDPVLLDSFGLSCRTPEQARAWVGGIGRRIQGAKESGADILLFDAGADPHIDDPLGGFLTTEEMLLRDRLVFETCAELALPCAWHLGGGYQVPLEATLLLHTATLEAAARAGVTK